MVSTEKFETCWTLIPDIQPVIFKRLQEETKWFYSVQNTCKGNVSLDLISILTSTFEALTNAPCG
jgi:hypothetical protein